MTALAIAAAIIALAAALWFYGYYARKSNDNLPSLTSIAQMDEAEVNEILYGYRRGQLAEVWGAPDESSSAEDVWRIADGVTLTVTYRSNDEKAVACALSKGPLQN